MESFKHFHFLYFKKLVFLMFILHLVKIAFHQSPAMLNLWLVAVSPDKLSVTVRTSAAFVT